MTDNPQPFEDQHFGDEEYTADIEDSTTKVGASKGNQILGLIVLAIFIIGVIMIVGKEEDPEETPDPAALPKQQGEETKYGQAGILPKEIRLEPIVENIDPDLEEEQINEVPELEVPELPPIQDVEIALPEANPIIPEFKAPEPIVIPNTATTQQSNLPILPDSTTGPAPISSEDPILHESAGPQQDGQQNAPPPSIMLLNSGGGTEAASDEYYIQNSAAETADATKIQYPERTIAQGKIVDAVLETAINTDFEGKVRAIISRDIFADWGKAILIPRGSRLIGSYSGSVATGQTRVFVVWERLIRPDAVDIQIDSPAADQFGRSGIPGSVDNKYLEVFNNSILLSLITIGTAFALEGATGSSEISVTEDEDGDTTTAGSATDFASEEIIDTIGTTAQTVLSNLLNVTPTITVPQGTRVKVFVNKDLIFPPAISSNVQIID